MIYRATVIKPAGRITKEFKTLMAAAQWIDFENNSLQYDSLIETFDENGNKKDGFFYTEKAK